MIPAYPVVQAIAWTHFQPPADVPWSTDADGGQALAEFAGRACYQSWNKPNPATATNAGYLAHIREVGHFSVLEHGTVTLYFTGVSRSFTHELVRHRHFSFSQLSQRYVADDGHTVVPWVIADDPDLMKVFTDAAEVTERAYTVIARALERRFYDYGKTIRYEGCKDPANCGREHVNDPVSHAIPTMNLTAARKAARQAARAILPNATETRIVVTGNYRTWRHFIDVRATEHADAEIRHAAILTLNELLKIAPAVFADYEVSQLPDGSWVAATPHAERS